MRARVTDDRGETLVELMVALTVLSIAVVAVIGGMALAIGYSDTHRKQATAGTGARDLGEALLTRVAAGGYQACAKPGDYQSATGFQPPPGFTHRVVEVRYWNTASWSTADAAACAAGNLDQGLQQVTVEVANTDRSSAAKDATERLVVVLRKPCTPEEAACS